MDLCKSDNFDFVHMVVGIFKGKIPYQFDINWDMVNDDIKELVKKAMWT